MTSYLLLYYILRFFILIYLLRRVCVWVYFWQLKEYRWRRIKEEVMRNPKVVPWKITAVALSLFSLSFGFFYAFNLLVPIYFFAMGAYAIFKIFKGQWLLPKKLTPKVLLIIGLATFFIAGLTLLNYVPQLQAFLIVDAFLPLFVSIIVKIVEIPVSIIKKSIIKKAQQKIKKFPKIVTIGITGSYGKTSVKKYLSKLLKCQYGKDAILTTPGHVNTEIGIAQLILKKLSSQHKFFICEMGAYHKSEIERTSKLVKPKVGILTGINEQHLALFGSLQNTIQAKSELIKNLPKDGLAIFNGDDKNVRKVYQSTQISKSYITLSSDKTASFYAKDVQVFKDHIKLVVVHQETFFNLDLPIIGQENLSNVLLAILAAYKLNISLEKIQSCLEKQPIHSGAILRHRPKYDLLDSTYSTNPKAFSADIKHLQLWTGKKIVVTPGIIELGSVAHSIHEDLGRQLAGIADLVILTRDYYLPDVQKGASDQKIKKNIPVIYMTSEIEIENKIKSFVNTNSVVLLEGRLSSNITHRL